MATIESDRELKQERWKPTWSDGVIGVTMAAVLVISGAWSKPIWLDEVLHFSMGEMSLIEALQTIDYTTIELNHGQTGAYMLADWALLQIFGASSVALRLPSLIAAAVLMWSAVVLLRNRGLHWFWQWLVLVALVASPTWVFFVGEARPYMPLAASAVALITFYTATPAQRQTWTVRIIGFSGLVVGALMHPYWIYFLGMMVGFGFLVARVDRSWPLTLRGMWQFIGAWLFVSSVVVFVVVGQLTWMRRVREFAMDPLEAFGSPEAVWQLMLRNHLTGYYPTQWWFLGLAAIFVVVLTRPTPRFLTLLLPLLLVLLGLMSSVLVSALSWIRQYWILERQWIGGIAVSVVALVWFFGVMWSMGAGSRWRWRQWPSVVFAVIVVLSSWSTIRATLEMWPAWAAEQEQFAADTRTAEEVFAELNDESAVYAAKVNIARGGPVWPRFTEWYWNQAGMRPEFREDNPGWTQWFLR